MNSRNVGRRLAAPWLRVFATASALLWATPLHAEKIHVLSAAAMHSVLKEIAGEFEKISGHKLVITYATMGFITQRILLGEAADLVIGSKPSISRLVKEGKIRADSPVTICKVGVGAVVPSGTLKPEVSSIEDFRDALLSAKFVVYANPSGGGAAGTHVARVIEKLGLTEQLRSKTKFGAGGDITEVTLSLGNGALGITQISEVLEKPGANFVGPLPHMIQNYTGVTLGIPSLRLSPTPYPPSQSS